MASGPPPVPTGPDLPARDLGVIEDPVVAPAAPLPGEATIALAVDYTRLIIQQHPDGLDSWDYTLTGPTPWVSATGTGVATWASGDLPANVPGDYTYTTDVLLLSGDRVRSSGTYTVPQYPQATLGDPFPPDPQPGESVITFTTASPSSSNLFDVNVAPHGGGIQEWYVVFHNTADSSPSSEQGPFAPGHTLGIGGPAGSWWVQGRTVLTDGSEIPWRLEWSI